MKLYSPMGVYPYNILEWPNNIMCTVIGLGMQSMCSTELHV